MDPGQENPKAQPEQPVSPRQLASVGRAPAAQPLVSAVAALMGTIYPAGNVDRVPTGLEDH